MVDEAGNASDLLPCGLRLVNRNPNMSSNRPNFPYNVKGFLSP